MMKSIFKNSFLAASLLAALSSCGKQTFDVVQSQQNSDAPGSVSIAPKVDILVAVDDTGSTAGLQAELLHGCGERLTGKSHRPFDAIEALFLEHARDMPIANKRQAAIVSIGNEAQYIQVAGTLAR